MDDNEVSQPHGRKGQGWRPSPKQQIMLVAIGFSLFHLILIAVWVWAVFSRN